MKRISTIWMFVLLFALMSGTVFGQAQYLINGVNPLDLTLETVPPNDCTYLTILIDPSNVITTPLFQAGFFLSYDPTQVSIGEVVPYDWDHGGPWDPGWSIPIPPDPLSDTYFIVVGNFDTVPVDFPIPICDVEFCCEGPGQSQITISTIPEFDTVVSDDQTVWDPVIISGLIDLQQVAPACMCELSGPFTVPVLWYDTVTAQYTAIPGPFCTNSPTYVWSDDCSIGDIDQNGLFTVPPNTVEEDCTICVMDTANTDINTGEPVECCLPIEMVIGPPPDSDDDGIPDGADTCDLIPNGPDLGVCCDLYCGGDTCTSDFECSAGWTCNMFQALVSCDCKASFDCDVDVDGTDAAMFKIDFGRSQFLNPCTNEDSCNGDFDCDVDVDGTDAAEFKRVFGRTPFPPYNVCISCVDDVYVYGCSY